MDPSPEWQVQAPEDTAHKALGCLENWCKPLDVLLGQQRQLEIDRQNLGLVHECITAMSDAPYDGNHLSHKSHFLYKGVFACPRTEQLAADICARIDEFVPDRKHNFFIVVDQ